MNNPILIYLDFNSPFVSTTDASYYAVSAILSQGQIPNDKAIAYASQTHTGVEYSTIEKELLRIMWDRSYFRSHHQVKKRKDSKKMKGKLRISDEFKEYPF